MTSQSVPFSVCLVSYCFGVQAPLVKEPQEKHWGRGAAAGEGRTTLCIISSLCSLFELGTGLSSDRDDLCHRGYLALNYSFLSYPRTAVMPAVARSCHSGIFQTGSVLLACLFGVPRLAFARRLGQHFQSALCGSWNFVPILVYQLGFCKGTGLIE